MKTSEVKSLLYLAAMILASFEVVRAQSVVSPVAVTKGDEQREFAAARSRIAARKGEIGDFDLIGKSGRDEDRHLLEDDFETEPDVMKISVVNALIRMHDVSQVFWDRLSKWAEAGIQMHSPDLMTTISRAERSKIPIKDPPQDFALWAQANHLSVGDATDADIYLIPGRLALLAETGDTRAIPILREALAAENPMMQIEAAKGLAQLKDEGAVTLIVGACERAPDPDESKQIAEALVYFRDNRMAQETAQKMLSPEALKLAKDSRDSGRPPLGWKN